jgi:hypothetical protein
MGPWYIGRLAAGGSIDGPKYECKIRAKDDRPLTNAICVTGQASRPEVPPVVPAVVAKFAPLLKFTRFSGRFGYPMSAQPFFDALPKDANGVPVDQPGKTPVGIENTDISTLHGSSIPTCYKMDQYKNQVRILYWFFYGYQHFCVGGLIKDGFHNGDWEHVDVILSEDQKRVAAVGFYQHGGHYVRTIGQKGICSPAGTGRCEGNSGFYTDGVRPVVYVGRGAHGNYHNANSFLPGTTGKEDPEAFQCTYYGDYRDPMTSADDFDTSRNLIDLDGNQEPWLAKDRAQAQWHWGPDGVSNHPTQWSPFDAVHQSACQGTPTYDGFNTNGCYKSECIAGDDQASEDCLKECKPGYNNTGLFCSKGILPSEWEVYGRLTGGNKYSYPYTIPWDDTGIAEHRRTDKDWNNIPSFDPLPPDIRSGPHSGLPRVAAVVPASGQSSSRPRVRPNWRSGSAPRPHRSSAPDGPCAVRAAPRWIRHRMGSSRAADATADKSTRGYIDALLETTKAVIARRLANAPCNAAAKSFYDQQVKAASGK